MYAAGQNQVAGMQIRVFKADGAMVGTFTFPAAVPIGLDQSTILIATAVFLGVTFGLTLYGL